MLNGKYCDLHAINYVWNVRNSEWNSRNCKRFVYDRKCKVFSHRNVYVCNFKVLDIFQNVHIYFS